ncbi:mRNA cleavage and polyadenylation specificity factor complex subunit pta1 [Fulvia fulva]|uniref:mRNA cleavage and polyadenylation specificity factor complex subunit pta1 n=1 Tax=Passalora fulva TaxID=5499 RepID=A0A9Q8P463_PASFU|nr:mRNA cleavage and polyadenylation specificity factor complex subunit pta1 [Fulvia fulva]KAK4636334.1 mRNA cleavage and polyadenylation specificity factor complex subunit pta1 [Fulvia fulva]KAK4638421.1 mRNA cleavage and polyadenylation specificity factor complex subunit pta1 [Fulvia fulva]UJO12750.1 mRNA cleavage and polyadenylation specificity factor complex subunit pta1 [Fulvia fulva]WPV09843.1 mRNA cleavage and polyadenylation specificity factor complex subunit pta1 [Fulvia fulva]WPV2328
MASPAEALQSLNSAREIVLKDHTLYPQVVLGVLQVIAYTAQLEVRRWGADFLAETFASQAVTPDEKQQMAPTVLETLKGWLNRKELMGEDEDTTVVKSAVQCAASVYPFIFRHTVNNTSDSESWSKMATIKSSILRRMDTASPGVRICCIKFVACVVQTQTPGLIADPRRPEQNEISLALVPRDHTVIPPANLEAEASGLLDRLLGVLQDNLSDALIVTATLNSLARLVHRRASISSKILATVLQFNPLRAAGRPMTTKDKLTIKSMTRTTMSFLLNCLKRNPNSAFAGRIQQQIERLKHGLIEVFSENHHLKRPAPEEPVDGLDDAKRQRLDADATNGTNRSQQHIPHTGYPPLPPGPMSLAQLWTLTNDRSVAEFQADRLPIPIIQQLIPAMLNAVPKEKLDEAINAVRSRWLDLTRAPPMPNVPRPVPGDEDDDDYDPTFGLSGENQAVSRLEHLPLGGPTNDVASTFTLPPPAPVNDMERDEYSKTAVTRVFETLKDMDNDIRVKGKPAPAEHSFNRLAAASASGHDREGWVALMIRVATRGSGGNGNGVKGENGERSLAKKGRPFTVSWGIRESLLNYVMEAFRQRIDVAIMWLSEEWYSDRLSIKERQAEGEDVEDDDFPNYWHWTLRTLDAMVPYFDVKDDKVLIRFLSEVPAINEDVLDRVKRLAEDPERIQMSTKTLLYLIMFRPPVRQLAIDCAEQMWKENPDAKPAARKILTKWRPGVLEQEGAAETKTEAQ